MEGTQLQSPALAYARDLHANVTDWYKTVETKAQVILTLNGVFISFFAGSILTKRSDIVGITLAFGPETWIFIGAMALSTALAILSAVWCLRARGLTEERRAGIYAARGVDRQRAETMGPELSWFFFLIAGLDPMAFAKRIRLADEAFQADALVNDSVILARFVTIKHTWINRGFILTGLALIFFGLTGISYIIRVASA